MSAAIRYDFRTEEGTVVTNVGTVGPETVGSAVGKLIEKMQEDPTLEFDDATVLILRLAAGGVIVVSANGLNELDEPDYFTRYIADKEVIGDGLLARLSLLVEA